VEEGSSDPQPSKKYEIKQDGHQLQLQIHELTAQDSGTYKCCAGRLVTTASLVIKGKSVVLNQWAGLTRGPQQTSMGPSI